MTEYHKIDSVFKRDQKGNFIIGEWSRPEFEYLQNTPWTWTEKIDGTNIRIIWDGDTKMYDVRGRTDNAQLPPKLLSWINSWIDPNFEAGRELLFPLFGSNNAVLYGEGYGAGIQKGGGNYSPDQKFILFDVRVGNWWLKREDVVDIALKLGINVVPQSYHWGEMKHALTLTDMIDTVSISVPPTTLIGGTAKVEGWVGTPVVPLFARNGDRIITKVKYRDFKS